MKTAEEIPKDLKDEKKDFFDCSGDNLFSCLIQKALDTSITGKLIGMLVVSLIGFSLISLQNYLYQRAIDEKIHEIQFLYYPQYKVSQYILRGLNGFKISLIHIMNSRELGTEETTNSDILANRQRIDTFKHMLYTVKTGGQLQDVAKISQKTMDVFMVDPASDPKLLEKIDQIINEFELLEQSFDNVSKNLERGSEEAYDSNLETLFDSMDLLHEMVTGFATQVNEHNNFMIKDTGEIVAKSQRQSFFISLVIAIILSIGTILYILIIVVPLKDILVKIKTIARGDGELSERIEIKSCDEVGQLAMQLNRLVDNIFTVNSFKGIIEEEETPADVQQRLATLLRERYHFAAMFIYEIQPNKNSICVAYSSDFSKICSAEMLENNALCRAKRTGHAISSLQYDGICKQFPHGETMEHHCIPMISGGKVISVVQILYPKNAPPEQLLDFEEEIKRASRYIKEATPVLEAKRFASALQESTLKDPMTDLYNRRFLESYMDTLIAGATRRSTEIGILMCDMDFFKEVNDTHGHEAGDIVIKKTAEIIETSVRASDMVIRYGGEEFLVLLIDLKDRKTAEELAQRIRSNMEATIFKLSGTNLKKTISVGYSMFPTDSDGFWEAIKFADVALYRAKEEGRNRVIGFTRDMWAENMY